MRLTSTKHIPEKVRRYALAQKLGSPRILYEPPGATRLHFFFGPVAIIIGAFIIVAYYLLYSTIFSWWPTEQAYLVLVVGIGWIMVGTWIFVPPLLTPPVHIYLCPKGLIYIRRKIEAIHWHRIKLLSKEIGIARRGNSLTYIICRDDEAIFVLKDDLPYLDRLGGFLEHEIVRQLLPRAIAAYEAGSALKFAAITITSEGINVQSADKLLPWYEVESVATDGTTLSIRRRGEEWEWSTFSISSIPNAGVFKGLVEYVLTKTAIPPKVQAYKAGFAVFFGTLCISQAGVSLNNNEELIPWSEIGSFGIGESEIIIRRKGLVNEWFTVPINRIPDVPILQELVDYILNSLPI